MASDVDICNLALSHIGDDATVTSINPPEGSAQAQHCKRFYDLALRAMLESHNWAFATRRVVLPSLSLPENVNQWAYAYGVPSDMLSPIAVLDVNAPDDYNSVPTPPFMNSMSVPIPPYAPQPFSIESFDDGTRVLYTNQQNAMLRYTAFVTDASQYSGLFVDALSRLLASYLAGPVVKGVEGRKLAQALLKEYQLALGAAAADDSLTVKTNVRHIPTWMAARA